MSDSEIISTGLDDLVVQEPVPPCFFRKDADADGDGDGNLTLTSLAAAASAAGGRRNCSVDVGNGTDGADADGHELNYTKVAVLAVIITFTIVGNICVILAIFLRNVKMSRMYYFILHLSLADLLTAFFTLLPELVWTFTWPYFYGGNVVCKAIKFLQMIGPYLSSYVLIMTAIDRFQAICHPLSNCTWTPRRSNLMIGLAWVISSLLCIPQALIFHDAGGASDSCTAYFPPAWGIKAYVTWFAVSNFFVPLIILIYCYGRICQAIWDNFNSKIVLNNHNSGRSSSPGPGMGRSFKQRLRRMTTKKEKEVRMRWTSTRASSRRRDAGSDGDDDLAEAAARAGETGPLGRGNENGGGAAAAGDTSSFMRITVEPPSNSNSANNQSIATCDAHSTHLQTSPGSAPPRCKLRSSSPSSSSSSSSASPSPVRSSVNPRSHSIRGISRAKIKTVKLTVVVIFGYIVCSTPFICVQLWVAYGSPSDAVLGSINWLFWLLTLNSVTNPWIYMFFNVHLVESLGRACCPYADTCSPCIGGGAAARGGFQGHGALGGRFGTGFGGSTGPGAGGHLRSRRDTFFTTGGISSKTQVTTTSALGLGGVGGVGGSQERFRSRSNTGGSNGSAYAVHNSNHNAINDLLLLHANNRSKDNLSLAGGGSGGADSAASSERVRRRTPSPSSSARVKLEPNKVKATMTKDNSAASVENGLLARNASAASLI